MEFARPAANSSGTARPNWAMSSLVAGLPEGRGGTAGLRLGGGRPGVTPGKG